MSARLVEDMRARSRKLADRGTGYAMAGEHALAAKCRMAAHELHIASLSVEAVDAMENAKGVPSDD